MEVEIINHNYSLPLQLCLFIVDQKRYSKNENNLVKTITLLWNLGKYVKRKI